MRRVPLGFLAAVFVLTAPVLAQIPGHGDGLREDTSKTPEKVKPAPVPERPARVNGPVLGHTANPGEAPRIDLGHITTRNSGISSEPSQDTQWTAPVNPQPQDQGFIPPAQLPNNWDNNSQPVDSNPAPASNDNSNPSRFISAQPGAASNVAHHHHPFTQGYVRKKLQKLGIQSLPTYITDRRKMLDADKDHSVIRYPKTGPGRKPLTAAVLAPKNFNSRLVKDQMTVISASGLEAQIPLLDKTEKSLNHYFWHKGNGFDYCHYVDSWGYHWYGWFVGDSCFWTRFYGGRWWCYDPDNNRWCFWNGGWWWQDPYHVGDLYLYNYGQYIPCDSAKDPVVTTVQVGTEAVYSSPDGTRMVKVIKDAGDAFLFDTAIPPSFEPIYLASQVTGVKYSNTSDGSALQVMLTHGDGSYDLFDSQGNPLNFSSEGNNGQNP